MGKNNSDFSGKNNPNYRSGNCVRGADKQMYVNWNNMKQRCFNSNHPAYKNYGARQITICKEWLDFMSFKDWSLKNGYSKEKCSLDRININGNYEPVNCRWTTVSDNSRRKRTTKITFEEAQIIRSRLSNGEDGKILAKEYNVVYGTIWFIENNFTHTAPMQHSIMKKLV